jgi:putative membrane protein
MLTGRSIPIRYAFGKVKHELVRMMAFSLALHAINFFFRGSLPQIPMALPILLGTSITLLLAFNINHSYDRWWEARKVWGAIVNDSRSLVLQVTCFVVDRDERARAVVLERVALRQIAFCHSLGQSLRGRPPITPAQARLLSSEDLRFTEAQTNQPLGVLMCHQMELRALTARRQINCLQQIQIDATLVRLCEAMGRAERIKNTVFPVTYRLFTHYFIYLFLIFLSIALIETVAAYEAPILVLLTSTYFLLEKTALHMQDPFDNRPTDTSVTAIARAIEINLRQLIGDDAPPPPAPPPGFYVM